MKKLMSSVFAAIFALGLLSGCDRDNDPAVEMASVMVVHASPNAPGVDLLIDDAKINNAALTYPNNTGYLEVASGNRNFKINAAGTATSVINANVNLDPNRHYSIFAANTLANIEPVVFTDDLTAPAAGRAHVRFLHLSPDAPAVDVAVANGGPVLFSNVRFKEGSAFLPVDAGTYNLEVRLAGTTNAVLQVPNVQLTGGSIYTVFARGFVAPAEGNNNALGAQIIMNR